MRVDQAARAHDLTQVKERVAELYEKHIRSTTEGLGVSPASVRLALSGDTPGGEDEKMEWTPIEHETTAPPRQSTASAWMQAAVGQASEEGGGMFAEVQNGHDLRDCSAATAVSGERAVSESERKGEGQLREENMQMELTMLKHDIHHIASKFRQMEEDMSHMRRGMLQVLVEDVLEDMSHMRRGMLQVRYREVDRGFVSLRQRQSGNRTDGLSQTNTKSATEAEQRRKMTDSVMRNFVCCVFVFPCVCACALALQVSGDITSTKSDVAQILSLLTPAVRTSYSASGGQFMA